MYKSNWEVRREGERAAERYSYSQNPYDNYGSYDDQQHHNLWNDGFRYAKHQEEERRQEEEREERRQAQLAYDREIQQRQIEEEQYWEEMNRQEQEEDPSYEDKS